MEEWVKTSQPHITIISKLLLSLSLCLCVQQGQCKYDTSDLGAKISGSVYISKGNEANLQAAVASTGPVAVAVDGSNKAFRVRMYVRMYACLSLYLLNFGVEISFDIFCQNYNYDVPGPFKVILNIIFTQLRTYMYVCVFLQYYDSGIYNLPGCSSYSINTALLIIGYGKANDSEYWLLKNR